MSELDRCRQIIDTESGRVLLYRDEVEAVLSAGDTISRRQAIDALGGNEPVGDPSKMDDDDVVKMWERIRIINIINKLPSVQPEQRWIPVTESLPEDGQLVIFSTKTGRVHQGKYYGDDSVNQWYSAFDKMRAWNNVVNAWMPLPEPYAERRTDG